MSNWKTVVLTKPQLGELVIPTERLAKTLERNPGWKLLHQWDMPSKVDAEKLAKYLSQDTALIRSFIKYDPVIVPGRRYGYHLIK